MVLFRLLHLRLHHPPTWQPWMKSKPNGSDSSFIYHGCKEPQEPQDLLELQEHQEHRELTDQAEEVTVDMAKPLSAHLDQLVLQAPQVRLALLAPSVHLVLQVPQDLPFPVQLAQLAPLDLSALLVLPDLTELQELQEPQELQETPV